VMAADRARFGEVAQVVGARRFHRRRHPKSAV
jgi:hypothetical protein